MLCAAAYRRAAWFVPMPRPAALCGLGASVFTQSYTVPQRATKRKRRRLTVTVQQNLNSYRTFRTGLLTDGKDRAYH